MGCLSFGGFGSFLATAKRDLVERLAVLKNEDIVEAITYINLLPGPSMVQMVSFLALRLWGVFGAVLAVVSFVLPSFCVMLLLSLLYSQFISLSGIESAIRGLNAAVAGLLAFACYEMAQSVLKSNLSRLLAAMALIVSLVADVPIAVTIIGAGLIQIVLDARQP